MGRESQTAAVRGGRNKFLIFNHANQALESSKCKNSPLILTHWVSRSCRSVTAESYWCRRGRRRSGRELIIDGTACGCGTARRPSLQGGSCRWERNFLPIQRHSWTPCLGVLRERTCRGLWWRGKLRLKDHFLSVKLKEWVRRGVGVSLGYE